MTSPVTSSTTTVSPSSLSCACSSSSPLSPLENKRSTLKRSDCTALASVLSAGPAASWTGRIRSGSIGFVEFGRR